MSDRQQAVANITRRGFLRATVGSLVSLPAIGGVGLFSQERVAHALTTQDEAGASFTNEQLAKITVVRRNQMAVVAVDMSKVEHVVISNGGLESGTIPPEAFVVGTSVTLTSRYNKKSQTLVTDSEGKVIFDISEMAENEEGTEVDKLDRYEFNGTIEIACDGFRTFKTALIRVHGTDVLVAPTRSFAPGDSTVYPHMISFNEWDVLYIKNQFLTTEGNTDQQRLAFEGRGFGSEGVTVTWREQGTGATFASTKVAPRDGVVSASFEGQFLKLGAAGSLELDKAYELAVTQGATTYVWPLQMSLVKGVLNEAVNTKLDFALLSVLGEDGSGGGGQELQTSALSAQEEKDPTPTPFSPPAYNSDTSSLGFTWPDWVPVLGGQKANWLNLIKTPLSITMDPFGFVQITYTIPLYGYRYDSSKPDEGGWKRYPYDSMSDAYRKSRESTEALIDTARSGFNAWKNGASCSDIKTWGVFDFQVYAQFMAALKWDNGKGIFQGMGGGQLRAACSVTFTMNFYAGPVPILISFGFNVDVIVALMCDVYSLRKEATDLPLEKLLPTYLVDVTAWRFDFDNSGLNVSLTLSPSLSVGVGITGIASISLRGKAVFTMSYAVSKYTNKPKVHTIVGYSASVDIVIQAFFYTQTYNISQLSKPYTKLHDNWDGLKTQGEDFSLDAQVGPGGLSEFMGDMQIVTDAMLQKTSEASGMAAQSLGTQAEGNAVKQMMGISQIWKNALGRAIADKVLESLPKDLGLNYKAYRFRRPARTALGTQADEPQVQEAARSEATGTGAPQAESEAVAATPVAAEGVPAAEVASSESASASPAVDPTISTSVGSSDAAAAVVAAAVGGSAVVGGGETKLTAASEKDQAQAAMTTQPEVAAPAGATATEAAPAQENPSSQEEAGAQADAQAAADATVSFWHTGSSVRYADRRVVTAGDGLAVQADDNGFLPAPGVEKVSATGGVRPTSDVVISTNEDGGERLVQGDPRMKVIDIRTSTSAGAAIRATCSFRIGTVNVPDAGMRSRIIMTVLDASPELSWFVGTQRVIDFDIYEGADVNHVDLFDYDFGLAFSSYNTTAGGVEGAIDQVEIVVVSGRRAEGDNTSVVAAGTDLYFTYLQFYAQDLLSEDFASPQYLQLTLPANQVMDPEGAGDGLAHNISNINCVSKAAGQDGALIVTYLDRSAADAQNIFSDDDGLVTVRPRFLFFHSDSLFVDVMVPNSSELDDLLGRLNRSNASITRLTLSPEIAGFHTLTLQGPTKTYFYLLAFDSATAALTMAAQCPMLDSSINLVPWPAQDCYLTSFASAEYRATEEFLQGNRDTWDYSKWVLQKAWWVPTGSPENTYILRFEEIGPKNFNFSRFALNSSGTFIFWPEGRTGSDEHFYDVEGNHTVFGEDDAVYRIMACRVRNNADGSPHFSDPFIAADVPHDMNSLEAVTTFDRYAPFEVLSTELVDTGERMTSNTGDEVPLYHAARLWYTSVPNLQCATVVASNCTLPAVSAGGTAKFDVTIRNDGNSFLSGCHLQMYVHEVEVDEKGNALRDANGNYVDHGVKPVSNAALKLETTELDVVFADALQASAYNRADDDGAPTDVEPDRALAPGKRSVYRVEVPIPAEWGEETPNAGQMVVKYISFNATNPVMAEGGGLAAMSEDDGPIFQQFSVEPGSYPVVENRVSTDESKDRRFTERLVVDNPSSVIAEYADAPMRIEGAAPGDGGTQSGKTRGAAHRATLPKTGDPSSAALPLGLGLAGAALAAYGKRRAENERSEEEAEE